MESTQDADSKYANFLPIQGGHHGPIKFRRCTKQFKDKSGRKANSRAQATYNRKMEQIPPESVMIKIQIYQFQQLQRKYTNPHLPCP